MGYTTTIRSKRQRVVAALDIGTSKVCCLIAKTSPAPDWFEGKGETVQFEMLGFDHTRAEGLKAIEGQVLSENTAMLAMCRELGFNIAPDPRDPDTHVVRLATASSGSASPIGF